MADPLEGYTSLTSAAAGDAVDFHLRSDAAHEAFTLAICRRGVADTQLHAANGNAFVPGQQDDVALSMAGCDWPADPNCRLVVPADWASGYYVAIARSGDASCTMPFIIRNGSPGSTPILLKLSDTTSLAYNAWGGRSLYSTPFASTVSFDRPADVGLYEQYQLPFLQWAERTGRTFDFCSCLDLHANPLLLAPYRTFLSLGHDEYWSLEMRDQVEAFIAGGGNAIFFSANTCFWQIRLDLDGKRLMTSYKEGEVGHETDPQRDDPARVTCAWYDAPVSRPENSMTGVSYRNGAGWWVDPTDPARRYRGYTTVAPGHPLMRGTGLKEGDVFGQGTSVDDTFLGYETDAALLDGTRPLGTDGTPASFVPLATSDLRDWTNNGQGGFATMGTYRRVGTVFTTGTVNLAGALARGGAVEIIAGNVLADLAVPPQTVAVKNADFEAWGDNAPADWILDGAGSATQAGLDGAVVANQLRYSDGGGHALELDASAGETWLGQPDFALEAGRVYGAGIWVKAAARGATIRLQTTDTWTDFAVAEHSGSDRWECLFAMAALPAPSTPASDPAPIPGASPAPTTTPCRVKVQVAAGVRAQFARVVLVAT